VAVTFPYRRDGPPERRKEVSLEGVHKGTTKNSSQGVADKGKSLRVARFRCCLDERTVRRPSTSPLPAVRTLPSPSQSFLLLPYPNYGPATSSGLPPQEARFPPPLYVVCNMYWCFGMYCLVVCVRVGKKGGLRYRRRESSALLSQLQHASDRWLRSLFSSAEYPRKGISSS
jgi:hypothetical protein